MCAAVDPYVITQRDRVKYVEQFKALNPVNNVVTGQQARGFFLQSQLPPLVLGEIWSLADRDGDGKMDINEFSIACKLVNLKLRQIPVPTPLPPTMLASLSSFTTTPTLTPTGIASPPLMQAVQQIPQMAPVQPVQPVQPLPIAQPIQPIPQAMPQPPVRPPLPPQPILPPVATQIPQIPQQPEPLIQNLGSGIGMPQAAPVATSIMPTAIIPNVAAINQQPAIAPIVPITTNGTTNGSLLIDSLATAIVPPTAGPSLPQPPTPPSGTQQRHMSFSATKTPSIESPGQQQPSTPTGEWAVRKESKLKYTQLFNATDQSRSGSLTGAQARPFMVQSKLPQAQLAQIWALADLDKDGKLGCEEFVLAMYLCELGAQGKPIPAKLPPELVPPTFRQPTVSRHGSIASAGQVSRHGSISSQSGSIKGGDGEGREGRESITLANFNQTSFEDKRKENFDKGQAELDRRRRVLEDAARKEQEERERKEREEIEKKEKARLEAERKAQEELEHQLAIQRELEQEREEKRKRELEQKELARKELEKQRQIEWENQRIQEMQQQRQREQENVLKLKAQNQQHTIELGTLNDKVKELSQKICDTRVEVTGVKTVIDGMRSTRDTQMSEMASLKTRIKEQNAKLVQLSQEKTKLDSKSMKDGLSQEVFTTKQLNINQLRGKVQNIKEEVEPKETDVNANLEQLNGLKTQLQSLIDNCEEIYTQYDSQRNQVLELKNNKRNDSISAGWGAPVSQQEDAWAAADTAAPETTASVTATAASGAKSGYWTYRAVFEFSARNTDEITFEPGDIIMVPYEQNAEPGWLAGEINGHTGWFPETYAERCDDAEKSDDADLNANDNTTSYEQSNIPDETVSASQTQSTYDTEAASTADIPADGELYVACYPYESGEMGDLTFSAGEYITVIKKDGDWWTGVIGDRTGIFPSNYVQDAGTTDATAATTTDTTSYYATEQTANTQSYPTQSYSTQSYVEDARNQEEADTEVSEINTQKDNTVQDTYNRPMSTSSTTSMYRGKKGEVAQVIAPYTATSEEQLTLQRGQYIMIRKKSDTGWWEGEIQVRGKKRQVGWFPATYVKLKESGRLSGRSTPVSGGKIQMHETILDKVIALYPYKAQNDDELSFEKDDIISVMGRDEPEWWRGECNGLTGLFPSNYVGPFVTSGNV